MQQPAHPLPPMAVTPPMANITTEQIQKCLDENKQLILAILDNQNLGKLSECAQYQALLQKNLLLLAAIADAQPADAVRPQSMPRGPVPQGGHFMQQQQHMLHPRPSLLFNQQQMQEQQQQQQLHHGQAQGMPFPGQMGVRSLGGDADPRAAQNLGQGHKEKTNAAATDAAAIDAHRSSGTERGGGDAD